MAAKRGGRRGRKEEARLQGNRTWQKSPGGAQCKTHFAGLKTHSPKHACKALQKGEVWSPGLHSVLQAERHPSPNSPCNLHTTRLKINRSECPQRVPFRPRVPLPPPKCPGGSHHLRTCSMAAITFLMSSFARLLVSARTARPDIREQIGSAALRWMRKKTESFLLGSLPSACALSFHVSHFSFLPSFFRSLRLVPFCPSQW